MSKGSPIVTMRFEPLLLAAVEIELAKRNESGAVVKWSLSDFVRQACRESLAKRIRSRKGKKVKT